MRHITNAILYILLISITVSCSDNDSESSDNLGQNNSDFYVKATIKGEEQTYNTERFIFADLRNSSINGLYNLNLGVIVPNENNTGNRESLILDFNLETPIVEGTYNQPESLPLGLLQAFLGYQNVNLSNNIGETLFVTDTTDPVSTLQIIEITENTIQGTFSGIIQNPLVSNDLTITNGEFLLELNVNNE